MLYKILNYGLLEIIFNWESLGHSFRDYIYLKYLSSSPLSRTRVIFPKPFQPKKQ